MLILRRGDADGDLETRCDALGCRKLRRRLALVADAAPERGEGDTDLL